MCCFTHEQKTRVLPLIVYTSKIDVTGFFMQAPPLRFILGKWLHAVVPYQLKHFTCQNWIYFYATSTCSMVPINHCVRSPSVRKTIYWVPKLIRTFTLVSLQNGSLTFWIRVHKGFAWFWIGWFFFVRYGGHIVKVSQAIQALGEKDTSINVEHFYSRHLWSFDWTILLYNFVVNWAASFLTSAPMRFFAVWLGQLTS